MKPEIQPVRGKLHKALAEGCSMWAPVLSAGRPSHTAQEPGAAIDAPQIAGSSESTDEAAATVVEVKS